MRSPLHIQNEGWLLEDKVGGNIFEPVIQFTNEVSYDGENNQDSVEDHYEEIDSSMEDSITNNYMENRQSYIALDSNRAYISMYNDITNINQYTNDTTLDSNGLQSEGEIETARRSDNENGYETVE
ncbi:Hypothetical predicted protein [Mytilus galloprovincialis]|uniref:Uncharacterized protein n=1 Tax=Mytilus galloprovincialis TaxID=29158 RepID=A0A8B6BVP0_MYTGA|nr:Hypothetical predicted protein [Mytilus galloprovincialis]